MFHRRHQEWSRHLILRQLLRRWSQSCLHPARRRQVDPRQAYRLPAYRRRQSRRQIGHRSDHRLGYRIGRPIGLRHLIHQKAEIRRVNLRTMKVMASAWMSLRQEAA
jgi:hypothetical protein